jgi:hypothetical protein
MLHAIVGVAKEGSIFDSAAGLPDGIFPNQKSQFGYIF